MEIKNERFVAYFKLGVVNKPGRWWIRHYEPDPQNLTPVILGSAAKKGLYSRHYTRENIGAQYIILKGTMFTDETRHIWTVDAVAKQSGLVSPATEGAPSSMDGLTREMLDVIGLKNLIVMHEPIMIDGVNTHLGVDLTIIKSHPKALCMGTYHACPKIPLSQHPMTTGFVYKIPS